MDKRFGRIPDKTLQLYERTVSDVRAKVLPALPQSAGEDLRAFTLEKVLEVIFKDWHEHGNTEALSDLDLQDLSSFVEMSVALASGQLQAQGRPIYEAALQGLLQDWLYNWNADGTPGPPGR